VAEMRELEVGVFRVVLGWVLAGRCQHVHVMAGTGRFRHVHMVTEAGDKVPILVPILPVGHCLFLALRVQRVRIDPAIEVLELEVAIFYAVHSWNLAGRY
jgi:hypothetical protein